MSLHLTVSLAGSGYHPASWHVSAAGAPECGRDPGDGAHG